MDYKNFINEIFGSEENLNKIIDEKLKEYLEKRDKYIENLIYTYPFSYHRRIMELFGYKCPRFFGREKAVKNFYREIINKVSLDKTFLDTKDYILERERIRRDFGNYFDEILLHPKVLDEIEVFSNCIGIGVMKLISCMINYAKGYDKPLEEILNNFKFKSDKTGIILSIEIDSHGSNGKKISVLEKKEIKTYENECLEKLEELFKSCRYIYMHIRSRVVNS